MADSPASYLDAWERTVSRVARTCSDPNTLRWIPLLLLADPVARAAAQPPTPLGQLSQPSTQPAPEALPGARARSENRALPSQSAVNTANNPLTDIPALQIQNYLQPVLTGRANAQANTPYIRFILPYTALGRRNLMRLSLPVASSTWSPTATALGLGDLTIFSIPIVEVDGARAGIGPLLVVPTATSPALGLKRWQVGGQGIFSIISLDSVLGNNLYRIHLGFFAWAVIVPVVGVFIPRASATLFIVTLHVVCVTTRAIPGLEVANKSVFHIELFTESLFLFPT
jgi:hypothetical protein